MMKKLKQALSLTLALALSLALAVPASAAGTAKTVTNEESGTVVTMDGFLRVETNRYLEFGSFLPVTLTIHVVADNSTVTVEAMEGRRYATDAECEAYWEGTLDPDPDVFAYVGCGPYGWIDEESALGALGGPGTLLSEPITITVTPTAPGQTIMLEFAYGICFLCESDFAKLVPFTGRPIAAGWAQAELENAFDAELFPYPLNPFTEDCARGMTRAEFAAVALRLYTALQGAESDVDSDHPFTDVKYGSCTYASAVGEAYNLGIVNGTGPTTFSPDATLTREQAAVMLARVYSKVYGDIPTVTATSFGDDGAVSSWAKSGVAFMADKGIVNGVGGNRFAPKNTLSIQEAVVMAYRMLENLK